MLSHRDIALDLLAGRELSNSQLSSRDAFYLGFGGRPVLLPPPLVYIPSRIFRVLYRISTSMGLVKHFVKA